MTTDARHDTDYAGYVLALAAFCGYVATCHPLITAGDSGELAAAAWTLGISHPPGSPAYGLFGGLFSLLPVGTPAFRMTVMSALFAALTLMVVYRYVISVTNTRNNLPAFGIILLAGSAPVVWSNTAYVEVYAQALFMSVAALFLAALYDIRSDIRYAITSMFVIGLGTGAHYLVLLCLPGVTIMLLRILSGENAGRRLAGLMAAFAAGLSVWMYIPVRAAAGPAVNWGDPEFYSRFIGTVLRSEYGDIYAILERPGAAVIGVAGIVLMAVLAIAYRYYSSRENLDQTRVYRYSIILLSLIIIVACLAPLAFVTRMGERLGIMYDLCMDGGMYLPAILVPLAFVGIAVNRNAAMYGASAALVVYFSAFLFRLQPAGALVMGPLAGKFLLPVVLCLAVPAGAGAVAILGLMNVNPQKYKMLAALARYLLLIVGVMVFINSAQANNRVNSMSDYDIARGVYAGLGQDAVLVADGDNMIFLGAYLRHVEDIRPDVAVYDTNGRIFEHADNAVGYFGRSERPAYVTGRPDIYGQAGDGMSPYGMSRTNASVSAAHAWRYFTVRVDTARLAREEFQTRQLAADYYFAYGADLMESGDPDAGWEAADMGLAAAHDQLWAYRAAAGLHMRSGEFREALGVLESALGISSGNRSVVLMYAECLRYTGDSAGARQAYERAIRLGPSYSDGYIGLASLLADEGDFAAALEVLNAGYARVDIGQRGGIADMIKLLDRGRGA